MTRKICRPRIKKSGQLGDEEASKKGTQAVFAERSRKTSIEIPKNDWKKALLNNVWPNMKGKGMTPLEFFPPTERNGTVVVDPPKDVLEKGSKQWDTWLVGYFLDRPHPFQFVKKQVEYLWKTFGPVEVYTAGRKFMFKFPTVQDRDNVIDHGYWHIGERLLVVQKWRPGTRFTEEKFTSVPMWVKFHHLPYDYWKPGGFGYFSSVRGKPLYAD